VRFWILDFGFWIGDAATGMDPVSVGTMIGAILIALLGGGYLGKRAATTQRVRLGEPVPEIPVRRVSTPPTWDQHAGLERRVTVLEAAQMEMRRDLANQFRELLEAGGTREARLGAKLEGIAKEIHRRIDAQFKTCMERPSCSPLPPTTRK
jgi:hypothetical protein